MYCSFYGLRERPFNLTPDPKYLYLGEKKKEKHKDALFHLQYGIRNRSGFVMVTGEIGTGKTTICRSLVSELDEDVELAFVFNPKLNPLELIRKINAEFGIDGTDETILDLTEELNAYLLQAAAAGKKCVLVIDEAQNLSPDVLEQIRLLSNLETNSEKLLQIMLIGQPELAEKLALQELRQLNQRITARYHLEPLDEGETLEYIAFRLHVAGGRGGVRFGKKAIHLVYKFSKGTPRVINAICDRALLIGYTRETHVISTNIVRRAAREIRGEHIVAVRKNPKAPLMRWAPVAFLILALAAIIVLQPLLTDVGRSFQATWRRSAMYRVLNRPPDPPSVPKPASPKPVEVAASAATVRAAPNELPSPAPAAAVLPPNSDSTETNLRKMAQRLAALDPKEAGNAALSALLKAWGEEASEPLPETYTAAAIEACAKRHSLSPETLTPSLEQLLAIGLPAFVRLRVEDEPLWVGLTHASQDGVQFAAGGDGSLGLSYAGFNEAYDGEAVVLWRDPAPRSSVLLAGRRGGQVARLKTLLRDLGRIAADNTSDVFGQKTEFAVAKLQAETGLIVDGMAGKQVRMVLHSLTAGDGVPSLSARAPQSPAALGGVGLAALVPSRQAEPKPSPDGPAESEVPPVDAPEPKEVAPAQASADSSAEMPEDRQAATESVEQGEESLEPDTEEKTKPAESDVSAEAVDTPAVDETAVGSPPDAAASASEPPPADEPPGTEPVPETDSVGSSDSDEQADGALASVPDEAKGAPAVDKGLAEPSAAAQGDPQDAMVQVRELPEPAIDVVTAPEAGPEETPVRAVAPAAPKDNASD